MKYPKNLNLYFFILFSTILLLPSSSIAQRMWSEQLKFQGELAKSRPDTARVHLLLKLGRYYMLREYYLYRSGTPTSQLDTAAVYADQAIKLSWSLHYEAGKNEAYLLKGDALVRKHDMKAAFALLNTLKDSTRFRMLVILGRNYLFHKQRTKPDLDSALYYLNQADAIPSERLPASCRAEVTHVRAMRTFILDGLQRSTEIYKQLIAQLSGTGNEAKEALTWHELSTLIPTLRKKGMTILYCYEQMLTLYKKINNQERQAWVLKCIGDISLVDGRLYEAELQYTRSLQLYQDIGYRNLHYLYDLLAVTCRNKGEFRKSNAYALKAIASMQATNDSLTAHTFYKQLANLYRQSGQPDRSAEWYTRTLNNRLFKNGNNVYLFRNADFFVRELIKIHRNKEALDYILDIKAKNKPDDIHARAILISSLAFCYQAVGRDDVAERYYLALTEMAEKLQPDNDITSDVLSDLGRYYIEKKQFARALIYLEKALDVANKAHLRSQTKDIQLMLYKAELGIGNYSSAVDHLLRHKLLNDSIFNETKSWQIEELNIQFETAKKDKDIKLLNSQNQLQRVRAADANRAKNIILVILVLSLIIIGLLVNQYFTNRRCNRLLEVNQKELDQKNSFLEALNSKQEKLLEEKEWLLKEVHHRVKNNLQMVTSLLYSQSVYVQESAPKVAIQDSLRRMQAMSLIHEKLYQHENASTIVMSEYISELIRYLDELSYILEVYNNLVNASLKNIDDLTMVMTDSKLRMSDAERLGLIDRIYRESHDQLSFLRRFNDQAAKLAAQRSRTAEDRNGVRSIYGIN